MEERRQVGRSTAVYAAPCQYCDLEIDAVRNGKPVEIFQVTCHWVAATGTGDDASSSMLNLLQRVESVGRQSSEKRVAVVNV